MSRGEPLPVDRLHNLENLLDMYEYKETNVLVNEAIANAVDAFRDHSIRSGKIDITFTRSVNGGYLSFHNNAPPMTEKQFYDHDGYHKVSFSAKQKGHGIGFAGVGAKLFLASKQGGEIITITGKGKNNFIASKMYRIQKDLRFETTQNSPAKDILEIPNYIHSFGTTYSVKLTSEAYRELKEELSNIVQFWWSYALITKQIVVTIDGKTLSPWLLNFDQFKKTFTWKQKKIPALCFISKHEINKEDRHIVYTVFGKRIHSKELDLAIRIKNNYAKRVFCVVDVSILADQLTSNKENFKKNFWANGCKSKIEDGFWKFLEEQKLLNVEFQQENQVVTNDLTKKLDQLLDTKDFRDLNPFLAPRKRDTLRKDGDGDVIVAEVAGEGKNEADGSGRNNGEDGGIGDGTSLVEDKDADISATKVERRARGLRLIFTKKLQEHNEEARVETNEGAIVIDQLHPMYIETSDVKKVQNYNLMRIIIEALIRHKNEEVNWDAKETMDRFRDFLHATWGAK